MTELSNRERNIIVGGGIVCAGHSEEWSGMVRDARGPGAFEGIHDIPLAVAIHCIYMNGGTDQDGGDVEFGLAFSRMGRAVLWTEAIGFHTLEIYDTPADAVKACNDEEGRQEGGPNPDTYEANEDGSVTLTSGKTGQPHTYFPEDLEDNR